MSDIDEDLRPYEAGLRSPSARERDSAAEVLTDHLESGDISHEVRLRIGKWLMDALWKEHDPIALESILNGLGAAAPCPQLPWHRVGEYLPKLKSPLLGEYGIGMLGECGDPAMIAFVRPYLEHPEEMVRQEAQRAMALLERVPSPSNTEAQARCACPGCENHALSDSSFCAFCEDQHYHSH